MEDIIIIDKDPNDPNDHDNAGEISFQDEREEMEILRDQMETLKSDTKDTKSQIGKLVDMVEILMEDKTRNRMNKKLFREDEEELEEVTRKKKVEIVPRRESNSRRDSSDYTTRKSDRNEMEQEDHFDNNEDFDFPEEDYIKNILNNKSVLNFRQQDEFHPRENPMRPSNPTINTKKRFSLVNQAKKLEIVDNLAVNYKQVESEKE